MNAIALGQGQFEVASAHRAGVSYRLTVDGEDRVSCSCPGYRFRGRCAHATALADQLVSDLRCQFCHHLAEPGDLVTHRRCHDATSCWARAFGGRIEVCRRCSQLIITRHPGRGWRHDEHRDHQYSDQCGHDLTTHGTDWVLVNTYQRRAR